MRTASIFWCFSLFAMACGGDAPTEPQCDATGLSLQITEVVGADCGVGAGKIVASAGGVPGEITYRLDEGSEQTSGVFNGVRPGIHVVTARHESNCILTQTVTVPSGISFKDSIKPIIDTYCAIDGCHNGSGNIDFRVFENLKKNPADIKSRTQSGNMPKTGTLTRDQIEKIACWVDDGAPNN